MKSALVALIFAGAAEEGEFQDVIFKHYGTGVSNIRIVEDSWMRVRGKARFRGKAGVRGPEISIPADEVKDTEYADALPGFNRAKSDALQARYTRAIDVLTKLIDKADEKPWSLQYLLYYCGYARLQRADRAANDLEEARKLLRRLISEVPDSRFLFEAHLGMADSYYYEQNWDEADKAYKVAAEKLDEASRKTTGRRGLTEYYARKKRLAELKQVQTLEARKKWSLAKIRYSEIAASGSRFGDIAAMAKSGVGRCLVAVKEYAQAIEFFERMIREAEEARQFGVLGGAYCGLGDAYFGKEEYLPAMWNYKRVTVMYFTDAAYAAKAHFRAGRCYEMLGRKEKNALKFGRRHYNRVVELYPDSPWKDEAGARLKVIRGEG